VQLCLSSGGPNQSVTREGVVVASRGVLDESEAPLVDLQRVSDAQRRFLAAVQGLTDADGSKPSPLPGWTIGHVLTHVARNADSHTRRTEAALRGEIVDQYPGGYPGREAAIEAGAARNAGALRADVASSADALHTAWAKAPAWVWARPTRDVAGRERPLHGLPARRWQELEVHVVDLGIGITHRDWPDEFVAAWLPRLRAGAAARLPPDAAPPAPGVLDDRDELAWLFGRLDRPGLPSIAPWG
jgi:maleylpyruvate isomerase